MAKLRVTDIRDGMDWVGLHHQGTVNPEIRPLWRTKAAGFAQTYRNLPTRRVVPQMTGRVHQMGIRVLVRQAVRPELVNGKSQQGDFLVVDTCDTHTPAIGSLDSMVWAAKGVRGVLTNGGTRDTDEVLVRRPIPVVEPLDRAADVPGPSRVRRRLDRRS